MCTEAKDSLIPKSQKQTAALYTICMSMNETKEFQKGFAPLTCQTFTQLNISGMSLVDVCQGVTINPSIGRRSLQHCKRNGTMFPRLPSRIWSEACEDGVQLASKLEVDILAINLFGYELAKPFTNSFRFIYWLASEQDCIWWLWLAEQLVLQVSVHFSCGIEENFLLLTVILSHALKQHYIQIRYISMQRI